MNTQTSTASATNLSALSAPAPRHTSLVPYRKGQVVATCTYETKCVKGPLSGWDCRFYVTDDDSLIKLFRGGHLLAESTTRWITRDAAVAEIAGQKRIMSAQLPTEAELDATAAETHAVLESRREAAGTVDAEAANEAPSTSPTVTTLRKQAKVSGRRGAKLPPTNRAN